MAIKKLSPIEKRAYLLPYDSWANRIGVHQFIQDIPLEERHPSRNTLETIEAGLGAFSDRPKLILWAGRDFCFDERFLARWRQDLSGRPG